MKYRLYKKTKTKTYFFQFLENDSIFLQSQPYETASARNNGLRSVINNGVKSSQYKSKELNDGKSIFFLLASNGEEIARSPALSDDVSSSFISTCIKGLNQFVEGNVEKVVKVKEEYKTDGITDDYKRLSFYEPEVDLTRPGFQSFAKNGEYYFVFISNNEIVLISEGYESEEQSSNGIDSVIISSKEPSNFIKHKNEQGKHYFNLNAKNNQEIGTSAWFNNESDRQKGIDSLSNYVKVGSLDVQDDEPRLENIVSQQLVDVSYLNDLEVGEYDSNIEELIEVTQSEISFVDNYHDLKYETKVESKNLNSEQAALLAAQQLVKKEKLDRNGSSKKEYPKAIKNGKKKDQKPKSKAKSGEIALSSSAQSKKESKSGSSKWAWLLLLVPLLILLFKTCGSKSTDQNKEITKVLPKENLVEKTESIKNKDSKSENVIKENVEKNQLLEEKKTVNEIQKEKESIEKVVKTESKKEVAPKPVNTKSTFKGADALSKVFSCITNNKCEFPVNVNWAAPSFGYNESSLSPLSVSRLEKLADVLKKNPAIKLDIVGHIAQNEDNNFLGSYKSEKGKTTLSELRARQVKDLLVKKGIDASRLTFKGMGDSSPISTDYIEPGFRMNKRIDLYFRK